MSRIFRHFILICALLVGGRQSMAFSLLGPYEAWQSEALGYQVAGLDIGAPKNLGEEYRWNQPVITYGFDHSFLSYFGSEGVRAVEEAMGILNALPPVSQMSSNLFEFPFDTRRYNARAAANNLIDLKSTTLAFVLEEIGLAAPERWVWALRDRRTQANPDRTNYLVIQRNFDPVTYEPSKYVNAVRYTYDIFESDNPQSADAFESPVGISPAGVLPFSSVANAAGGRGGRINRGAFFTGLTRDDAGGLRYIYSPNNFNVEPSPAGTFTFAPDRTNLILLTNMDLTLFSLQSLTNSPAQMLALYPGLIISNATPRVTNQVRVDQVITTNVVTVALFTNRSQLLVLSNSDLATFSTQSRTSSPAQLQALYPGLEFLSTNQSLTTLVSIASIGLTNAGGPLFTNFNSLQVLTNQDLYLLSTFSRTSAPAVLLATYPGLDIRRTNTYVTTRVEVASIILTNLPNEPWGVPGFTNFVTRTNFVTNLVTEYDYVFGNVITNYASTQSILTRTISGVEREPWSVPSNPIYKTTTQEFLQDVTSGGFIIVPPTVAGYVFTGQTVTNLVQNTNFFFAATIISNGIVRNISLADTTVFTNVQYAAYPIELADPGSFVLGTNYVTNIISLYSYTYRNVLTNYFSNTGLATRQDLTILGDPFRPNFPRTTNAVTQNVISNFVNGGFLIVPTNLFGYEFTGQAITNIIPVTNITINAFNPLTGTEFQRAQIHYFTNVTYGVYPIEYLPQGVVTNVLSTNFVTNIVTFFSYNFANVITNYSAPTTPVARNVLTITPNPFFPALLTTNIVTTFESLPVASGGFLIDTNQTGYEFTGIQFTNYFLVTNIVADITNPGDGVRRVEEIVYTFTNVVYGVFPFVLEPAGAYLRPGVDKLTFLRLDRSEILGGEFTYTNRYRANIVTNRTLVPTTFQIVQTEPDILFVAVDLGTTGQGNFPTPVLLERTDTTDPSFQNNAALNDLDPEDQGGPGTINPQKSIRFNKIGPSIINTFPGQTSEESVSTFTLSAPFVWGLFDGSTNAPVIFPKDITLEQLEFRNLSTP